MAWTNEHPLKTSSLLLALSLLAGVRFIAAFGFRPVMSGALLFAALTSMVHCWQSGLFTQKAQG